MEDSAQPGRAPHQDDRGQGLLLGEDEQRLATGQLPARPGNGRLEGLFQGAATGQFSRADLTAPRIRNPRSDYGRAGREHAGGGATRFRLSKGAVARGLSRSLRLMWLDEALPLIIAIIIGAYVFALLYLNAKVQPRWQRLPDRLKPVKLAVNSVGAMF